MFQMVVGGYTQDSELTNLWWGNTPIVMYIAVGGATIWGQYYQSTAKTWNWVVSLKLNPGGNKIAVLFDNNYGYTSWSILIVSAIDGTVSKFESK